LSILSIDFETRATVDLTKTGVYPYAEHPDTDIWCMAWAFGDEEPEIWTPADALDENGVLRSNAGLPQRVVDHILAGGELRAWNAQFERKIWREIMVKRYGAPAVRDEQWVCTAAEAAAMALPRSLDQAGSVLGVKQQKDKDGYNLMMRMTRPRRIELDGTIIWWDVMERLARLKDYCKQDVRTEREIAKVIRRLGPAERAVYLLDQRINDRGVLVDLDLVRAAQAIVDTGVARANAQLAEVTGGEVTAVTNHARLTAWLGTQGVETPGVAKAHVASLLGGELPDAARRALGIRADAGRTSVAKLRSMLEVVCRDDRARGLALYHAASTGRWGGKLLQPHNFPRGEVDNIEVYIPDVLQESYDVIALFEHPVIVISSMLRSMIRAPKGHRFFAGDYSAIEARVLNWLAGQDDIVALFASGEDVYKHNAAKLYEIPLSGVQKFPHRQTGKFQELGCGYGMGAAKAVSAAKDVYGLEITDAQAKNIVDDYRTSHTYVVAFWYETENAVKNAIFNPGVPVTFGARRNLKAIVAGAWLYILLPSGRPLCYAGPRVFDAKTPWGGVKETIHYKGVDPNPMARGEWATLRTYGGHLVENIVQAVSRDILAEAMLRAEARGYTPVMHVHDELVTEVPEGFGDVHEFEQLMAELPSWAEGCPIAAEAWVGERYRK